MKKILVIGLLATALALPGWTRPISTSKGTLDTHEGRVLLNDKSIVEKRDVDGSSVVIGRDDVYFLGQERKDFYLFEYASWDGKQNRNIFFVVDLAGPQAVISNEIALPSEFQWGENNYVIAKGERVYLGFYAPSRMQFVYESGRITPNLGKWVGPKNVVKNFEPNGKDPCWNVSGVEECREEQERERKKRANPRK